MLEQPERAAKLLRDLEAADLPARVERLEKLVLKEREERVKLEARVVALGPKKEK